jgi:hypothetical protein
MVEKYLKVKQSRINTLSTQNLGAMELISYSVEAREGS